VIVLPQHEGQNLTKVAVDRPEGPQFIAVVNPGHAQALAQVERNCSD
jgi:hypothetical protein